MFGNCWIKLCWPNGKKYLFQKGRKIDLVIVLSISEEESIKRLSARRICLSCDEVYNLITNPSEDGVCDKCGGKLIQREDDTPQAISERLREYHTETDKVIAYLKKNGNVFEVDGARQIKKISQDLEKITTQING